MDRENAGLVGPPGLYKFNTVLFSIISAPATFLRLRNTVLQGLMLKACLVYLDDAVINDKNADGYMKNLRHVFLRLREAGLKLKPEKCNSMQSSVNYLGHIASSDV